MLNMTDKNPYTVFERNGSFLRLIHIADNVEDVQKYIGNPRYQVDKQICSLERSKERVRRIGHVLILGC